MLTVRVWITEPETRGRHGVATISFRLAAVRVDAVRRLKGRGKRIRYQVRLSHPKEDAPLDNFYGSDTWRPVVKAKNPGVRFPVLEEGQTAYYRDPVGGIS